MWIILLVIIGLGAFIFIQNQKTKGQWQTPTKTESPMEILKRRYAKGEIEKEDYERMKKELR